MVLKFFIQAFSVFFIYKAEASCSGLKGETLLECQRSTSEMNNIFYSSSLKDSLRPEKNLCKQDKDCILLQSQCHQGWVSVNKINSSKAKTAIKLLEREKNCKLSTIIKNPLAFCKKAKPCPPNSRCSKLSTISHCFVKAKLTNF